jgi:hypothetical protein
MEAAGDVALGTGDTGAEDAGTGVFAQPLHPTIPTLNARANAMSARIVLFKLNSPSF